MTRTAAEIAERKRYKQTASGQEEIRRYRNRKRIKDHTFLAIDGEGWTTNGLHSYYMILTSDPCQKLVSESPLTTEQCLGFICNLRLNPSQYAVSFFFDYDVTMMLRDMALDDPALTMQLFQPGRKDYVWWRDYGIKYRPHKAFTVTRQGRKAVTIHDGQGFYQMSFVNALRKFGIADEETLTHIASMKSQRSTFTAEETKAIEQYSQDECRLLVSLTEEVKNLSLKAQLNPYPYEGPGSLASNALTQYYGKQRHQRVMANMPADVQIIASLAMYGGRFEPLAVGPVAGTVREYDRHSAYPAAMANLPPLEFGEWRKSKHGGGLLNLSFITFRDSRPEDWGLCYALPVRRKSGELCFPREGSGWYWQTEYRDIPTLDVTEHYTWSWYPARKSAKPFTFILELFQQREEMERERKGSGIALKLALNTLYGKCAQTRPVPGAWLNFVYASLITSSLRTDMYKLYSSLPDRSVLMFATDAIFTTAELPVSHGLGGLELANEYHDFTIIQAGLYFDGEMGHYKTRGIPKKYVDQHYQGLKYAAMAGIEYPISTTSFRGLRSGLHAKNPATIGQWLDTTRTIETRTFAKRIGEWDGDRTIWTMPVENPNPNGLTYSRDKATGVALMRRFDDWDHDDETEGWIDE